MNLTHVIPLSEVARIIRESGPAPDIASSRDERDENWCRGCDSTRERIATCVADLCDLRPSERAEFLAECERAE